MKTLKVKWTGIRPLIMSNPQTVQLSNPYATAGRKLQSAIKAARKKQDEDKLVEIEQELARNDWEASAYFDPERGFFLPDTVIMACIRSGATASKKGRDVDRAMIVNESDVPISGIPKYSKLQDYFDDKKFRLECPAKVPPKTGALIWKTRCMIPTGWTVSFSLDYDESLIAEKTIISAMETAGALSGLGGWRPKFGRFEVEV